MKQTLFPYQAIENNNNNSDSKSTPAEGVVHTTGPSVPDVAVVRYPFDDSDYRPYKPALEVQFMCAVNAKNGCRHS